MRVRIEGKSHNLKTKFRKHELEGFRFETGGFGKDRDCGCIMKFIGVRNGLEPLEGLDSVTTGHNIASQARMAFGGGLENMPDVETLWEDEMYGYIDTERAWEFFKENGLAKR